MSLGQTQKANICGPLFKSTIHIHTIARVSVYMQPATWSGTGFPIKSQKYTV